MTALWMLYSFIVTAGMAVAAALLDRAASGLLRQRRWLWFVALIASIAAPGWRVAAPRIGFGRPTRPTEPFTGVRGATAASFTEKPQAGLANLIARAQSQSLGGASAALGTFWVASVILSVGWYAVAASVLARRRRTWREVNVDGERVLVAAATGPAVIGAFRPDIVVPEWSLDLPPDQRALMLEHERQHVEAHDPLLLQVAALLAAVIPWNLPAWWLVRRLRLAVELDCDARVLSSGRDTSAYGNLLLDVSARRLRPGPMLSPALFERTSSITKRIIAMYPDRPRFARARLTLGVAAAFVITALACDVPSPEAIAPDGKEQATTRLYGKVEGAMAAADGAAKAMVARYFPAVARGEGGPTVLFVVKSAIGAVVLTQAQPASELNRAVGNTIEEKVGRREVALRERADVANQNERVAFRKQPSELRMFTVAPPDSKPKTVLFKIASARSSLPTALDGIDPGEIATIDVSKHAPGSVAPNAVSMITIVLKPGAKIPEATRQ